MPVSGVLESLLHYWQHLPRTGIYDLPERAALQPVELQELLPRLALLKRLDRYNVQASMINMSNISLWRHPMVGINAFDLSAPDIKECRAEFYAAVLDHPAAAHLRETTQNKSGKPANVCSLYLPLADHDGTPTYIIACTVYENEHQYSNINDRLILDHHDVQELEFIDIGRGTPAMQFARPTPRTENDPDLNWWRRIMMPARTKSPSFRRLDS